MDPVKYLLEKKEFVFCKHNLDAIKKVLEGRGEESSVGTASKNEALTYVINVPTDNKGKDLSETTLHMITIKLIPKDNLWEIPCNQKRLIGIIQNGDARNIGLYRDLVNSGYKPCVVHNPPMSIQKNTLVKKFGRALEGHQVFSWNTVGIRDEEFTLNGTYTASEYNATTDITYTMRKM